MSIKRGDVYWADLDPVKGSEQGGIRPVVVVQNDKGNEHSGTTIAAITENIKRGYMPTHVKIDMEFMGYKVSTVMLEQIRTIDKKRLLKFIGRLPDDTMKKIDEAFLISIGVNHKKDKNKETGG